MTEQRTISTPQIEDQTIIGQLRFQGETIVLVRAADDNAPVLAYHQQTQGMVKEWTPVDLRQHIDGVEYNRTGRMHNNILAVSKQLAETLEVDQEVVYVQARFNETHICRPPQV